MFRIMYHPESDCAFAIVDAQQYLDVIDDCHVQDVTGYKYGEEKYKESLPQLRKEGFLLGEFLCLKINGAVKRHSLRIKIEELEKEIDKLEAELAGR